MAVLQGFNANNVEPRSNPEPIPAGAYDAVITASEMKPTKSGDGSYLEITFEIIDGNFKGRKLWARLNLENKNPVVVDIARSELSAICRAVGVLEPRDSCDLHNLPLCIIVKLKTGADGETRNEIRGYKKRSSSPPAAPQVASNTPPPWRRG